MPSAADHSDEAARDGISIVLCAGGAKPPPIAEDITAAGRSVSSDLFGSSFGSPPVLPGGLALPAGGAGAIPPGLFPETTEGHLAQAKIGLWPGPLWLAGCSVAPLSAHLPAGNSLHLLGGPRPHSTLPYVATLARPRSHGGQSSPPIPCAAGCVVQLPVPVRGAWGAAGGAACGGERGAAAPARMNRQGRAKRRCRS